MLAEILVRFFLGGAIVSLFAIVGGAWKPKTLAGTFAAAPSVALVALGAAYVAEDRAYIAVEARSMLLGRANSISVRRTSLTTSRKLATI
jgi:hypothetical protein